MNTFGSRLKNLRLSKSLTQAELGKALKVTNVGVAKWESDDRFPDKETLIKIADYFNVSLDYLFCRTDNPNGLILTNKELPFETKHDIKVEVDSEPTEEELRFIFEKLKEQGIEIKYKKV